MRLCIVKKEEKQKILQKLELTEKTYKGMEVISVFFFKNTHKNMLERIQKRKDMPF